MDNSEDSFVVGDGAEISGSADVKKGKITKEETKANADQSGLLARLLGRGNDAKYSISAIVIVGLLVIGLILSGLVCANNWFFCCSSTMVEDLKVIWGIITPLLTLTLGYVFGKGR